MKKLISEVYKLFIFDKNRIDGKNSGKMLSLNGHFDMYF